MIESLALADDLTGAIEVAGQFAKYGIPSQVTLEQSLDPKGLKTRTRLLVVVTASRHVSDTEARARVFRLATAARQHNIRSIYKKTDSTLRGNIGSELAGPPMVSRDTFQKWIVPYGKQIVDLVRSYGKKTIMHYHGQIKEVLPDFMTMNPDGLHTIEAPPVGNCTMSQAFEITQNTMALIGNIQYDCFRSYTPNEMKTAVRELFESCGDKRLILSPTAGPFDENPPRRLFENYERSLLISTPIMSEATMKQNSKEFNALFDLRQEIRPGTLDILIDTWNCAKNFLSPDER